MKRRRRAARRRPTHSVRTARIKRTGRRRLLYVLLVRQVLVIRVTVLVLISRDGVSAQSR